MVSFRHAAAAVRAKPVFARGAREQGRRKPIARRLFVLLQRLRAMALPFVAIVFAHMTRGIGSESQNCPLQRVLKSATSVGYFLGVDAHGAEIERASRVRTRLKQKEKKATKSAGRDQSRESVKTDHRLSFIIMAAKNLHDPKPN